MRQNDQQREMSPRSGDGRFYPNTLLLVTSFSYCSGLGSCADADLSGQANSSILDGGADQSDQPASDSSGTVVSGRRTLFPRDPPVRRIAAEELNTVKLATTATSSLESTGFGRT